MVQDYNNENSKDEKIARDFLFNVAYSFQMPASVLQLTVNHYFKEQSLS